MEIYSEGVIMLAEHVVVFVGLAAVVAFAVVVVISLNKVHSDKEDIDIH